jgi:hypothetical protein
MVRENNRKGIRGFSLLGVTTGSFIITSIFILLQSGNVQEYFKVRTATATFVEDLKEAKRIAIGHDVDRRIRLTSDHGFVRERRNGAGWMFEQAYTLPEGLEIFGPDKIEFVSRSALSPVGIYTISGPHSVQREVVLTENGVVSVR